MDSSASGSYEWYESDDLLSPFQPSSSPEVAGLPASWRHYGWWCGGLILSVAWMARSLKTGVDFLGATYVNHLTQDLWSLLITLAFCYGLVQFWKQRSEKVGNALCVLAAVSALAGHLL